MKECVFDQIIANRIPSCRVYEDDTSLAFLDHRPILPGHVLLVPKTHYETLADLPAEQVGPLFLAAQRLDPSTDGRPDPRPDVRETVPQLGNLSSDFDFSQAPRRPLLLPAIGPLPSVAPARTAGRKALHRRRRGAGGRPPTAGLKR